MAKMTVDQVQIGASSPSKLINASTTASLAVLMPSSDTDANTVRYVNEGPANVYVAAGDSTVVALVPSTSTASTKCTPVLAGEDVTFSRDATVHTHVSVITLEGTARLIVQCGRGV